MFDSLTGLPNATSEVFPQTEIQTCVVHLLCNTFAFLPRKNHKIVKASSKAVCWTADVLPKKSGFVGPTASVAILSTGPTIYQEQIVPMT